MTIRRVECSAIKREKLREWITWLVNEASRQTGWRRWRRHAEAAALESPRPMV